MYRAMVGLGLICALIVVSVFEITSPVIKQKKLELLQHALYRVFPNASQFTRYQFTSDGKFVSTNDDTIEDIVYAMYDTHNKLVGVTIKVKGLGYQDLIEMLYGYHPDQQIISGYQILASRETPGLGTRIETDRTFQKNFVSLDVTVNNAGSDLQNAIEVVNPGSKTSPWQIDTISGATISSRAVGNMVANSASQWIPRIQQRLRDFE